MQSESLTTSNCPAWPVGAVKSEREQTTRRLAISSGTARGALTPLGLTAVPAGDGAGTIGASGLRGNSETREEVWMLKIGRNYLLGGNERRSDSKPVLATNAINDVGMVIVYKNRQLFLCFFLCFVDVF